MSQPTEFPSARRCITYAMRDAGLLQDTDDPTPEQFANGLNRLNDMRNLWQTQGLKLWTLTDLSITLVSGTATYTVGPSGTVDMTKPLRALQGYFLDSSSNRRPIYPMSWQEYLILAKVTQTGAINQFLVNKQQLTMNVTFWLTPDATAATGTAHLLIQQQMSAIQNITADTGFPIEWFMGLRWGLASELCTGQPSAVIARCEKFADVYRNALEDWDVEDANTSFAPDNRNFNQLGRFR